MRRSIVVALAVMVLAGAALAACDSGVETPLPDGVTARGPSSVVVMHSAAVTNANGSAVQLVGRKSAVIQTTGTFTGAVNFEVVVGGSTWATVALADIGDTTRTRMTQTTTTGVYLLEDAGGVSQLRARLSDYTGGSVTVYGRAE